MIWLALDTTGPACSAAFARGDTVLACASEVIGRGHAERLAPMVEALRREAGLDWSDLDAIAVTRGPGSFTGLRVGLAFGRGIALATGVPVHGVTTFDAFAAAEPTRPLAIVIDAKRGELFHQLFDIDDARVEPAAAATGDITLAPYVTLTGSGAALVAKGHTILSDAASPPIEGVLAAAMAQGAPHPATPLYLRAPDARPQPGTTLQAEPA